MGSEVKKILLPQVELQSTASISPPGEERGSKNLDERWQNSTSCIIIQAVRKQAQILNDAI